MTASSQQSRALPLVEIRYYAAQRDKWELLLLRARQLAAGTIAARVPWAWHAPAAGSFDLDGSSDQRRDLIGFVRLCGQFGLQVLLHPGPLQADLLGGGVPAWLMEQHPAARALDSAGKPWLDAGGLPHPSALHPDYQAAARDWIAAFSAALRPFESPSGPIVALHTAIASTPDRLDYNQAAAGHPGAPEQLPEAAAAFSAWYAGAAVSATAGWLRAEGWSVALQHGESFWERSEHAEYHLATPRADSGQVPRLDLRGGRSSLLDGAPPQDNWLLRGDGSPRPDFWRVKMSGLLIAAAGADVANARAPADLALADARAHGAALAQRLRQASVAFDALDVEQAAPQDLARYIMIVLPSALALQPATRQKLARSANVVLLGENHPASGGNIDAALQLPDDINADQLAELIEERGGVARYAWADGAHIHLAVQYGADHTYLAIDNRRPTPYNGILAYRGRDGAVLHLHAGIGARCGGLVLLTDDEVYGAAIDGDGAEGGWLARGLRSSAIFNTGAGALARCGTGLLLTAPQSGRFQARRAEGWAGMRGHRLLLNGALLPAPVQIDAAHIAIGYVAEDARGQTDLYLILPDGEAPPLVRSYLATFLAARAAMLSRAAMLASSAGKQHHLLGPIAQAAESFSAAAQQLEAVARQLSTLDQYSAAWTVADQACQPAIVSLSQVQTRTHAAALAGQVDSTENFAIEQQLAGILSLATQLGGM